MISAMAFSPSSPRHHSVPFSLRNCQQQAPKSTAFIAQSSGSPTAPNNGSRPVRKLIVRKQRQKAESEVGKFIRYDNSVSAPLTDSKRLIDANPENALLPYNPNNVQKFVQDFSTTISLPPTPEYNLSAPYQGCYVPMPPLPQTSPSISRASSYDASRYVQRKPLDSHSTFLNQQKTSSDYIGNTKRRKGHPDIDETILDVIAQLKLYLVFIKLGVCATAWMFNTLLGVAVFIFIFGNGLIERLPRSKLFMLVAGLNADWLPYSRASNPAVNMPRLRKSSEMKQPPSVPINYVSSRPCS
ncbi:uncharacterized protein V1513DRAFT_448669 [Lipomyces chichibuensis]|uniref:uncharacterized protein n=1 Tax=Lipomyces chichibuensis TaxID=1546026 RepID=UPI0033438C82